MFRHLLQCFLATVLIGSGLFADASPVSLKSGATYKLQFDDVDGRKISTFDGHVSVIVVVTTTDTANATEVGDRVPSRYKGNQKYRFLTIVHFRTIVSRWFSPIATLAIRHRLDQEATRVQPEYDKRKIRRTRGRISLRLQISMEVRWASWDLVPIQMRSRSFSSTETAC